MASKQKQASKISSANINELENLAAIKSFNDMKEGSKKELANEQIENAISTKNIGKKPKITKKGFKKIVDAATDDKQLTRTKRSMSRHGVSPVKDGFKDGGRMGYKNGSMCKIATKGKGRAYGQNS